MSNYDTGNLVPSIDPRDLDDNATVLDLLVNGPGLIYNDRTGSPRKSYAGMEADIATFSSPNVIAFSALAGVADRVPYFTGAGALSLATLTAAARSLIASANYTAMLDLLNSVASVTLASSATVAIGAAASASVNVSGTTTITAFDTVAANVLRRVTFTGALTLTHNATSLILPGAANITTSSGDTCVMQSLGGGNWKCLSYTRASGKPAAFAYDRSNVVATVSDSGGVPAGGVIESGSNANGSWVKYADGTMECLKSAVTFAGGTVANGSVFRSVVSSVGAMPQTFVGTLSVFCTGVASAAGGGWAGCQVFWTPTTWGSWAVYTSAAASGNLQLDLLAKGRWK